MVALADVLEAAKIEELAREYRAAGYQVLEHYPEGNNRYDLVAIKDGQRIAVEVKARASLRTDSAEIRRLREEAQRSGFSEFRLVVVNPPRERTIEVAGLEQALREHLSSGFPEWLRQLSPHAVLDRVDLTDLESIEVTADGIRVVGSGMLDVTLGDGGSGVAGLNMTEEFPFIFDVALDHALHVLDASEITIDTSAFFE